MTSPVRAARPTPRRRTPEPPRPRLTVVRSVPPRRRRTGATFAVASIIVFASLLGATYLHGKLAEGQVHLDQVDQDIRAERAALAEERYELARLQDPARIAQAAEAAGMVKAEHLQWLSPEGDAPVVTGVDPADDPEATGSSDDATDDATDDDGTDDDIGVADETSEYAGTASGEAEA